MSSLSTLTCELIFYLTDGPQSSKRKPLFQQHLFSRTITQNLLSGSIFLGNPDTLVIEWVKLGFFFFFFPTSTRGCSKVVLTSPILHFWKFFFALTFLHIPLQPLPLICGLDSCVLRPRQLAACHPLEVKALMHPSTPAGLCTWHECWAGGSGPPSPHMTYDLESTITPRAPRNLSGLNFPKLKFICAEDNRLSG